jgi:hypothetical protein
LAGPTSARNGQSTTLYSPANLLARFYPALGIDLSTTLPDHTSRPMFLLDDCEPIMELIFL